MKKRIRKVSPFEFFINRFRHDPNHPAEKRYFNEWKQRFTTGHPENYMDKQSLRTYNKLKKTKSYLPQKYWKGKTF